MGCGVTRELDRVASDAATCIEVVPAQHGKEWDGDVVCSKMHDRSRLHGTTPSELRLSGGQSSLKRLEDARLRHASDELNVPVVTMLEGDLTMPPRPPTAGGMRSPRQSSPRWLSPRRGGRRLSEVIDEFSQTFTGYMEMRSRNDPLGSEDRLRRLFQLIDEDGNGTLEREEVAQFWQKMGWAHNETSIKTMFDLADKDSSGGIDWEEFSDFFRQLGSVDELRTDPEHEDWVPPRLRHKRQPRGRVWEKGTRPIRGYGVRHHVGHPSRVKCLAVDPTRRLYASCGRDDCVMRVFDLESGDERRSFNSHQDTVVCVALSPDRKHLATASRDGFLILWDSVSGVVIDQFDHPGVVTTVTFTPGDGKYVLSGCQDSICRKYQVGRGRMVHQSEKLGRGVVVTIVCADRILAVALSREKAVQLLDAKTLQCRWVLRGHATMVWSVGCSADHQHIMSACEQFVKVWEASTLKLLQCFPVQARRQGSPRELLGRDPEGCVNENNPLNIHAMISAHAYEKRGGRSSPGDGARWITAAYCPGDFSHFVCAVCSDRTMYFLHTSTGQQVLTLPTRAAVYCLAASQEHDQLVAGDELGNVYRVHLW